MRGFSLLELLVVLALLAAVTAYAIPRLDTGRGADLKTAIRVVITTLRQARSQAVSEGRPVLVLMDLAAEEIGIEGGAPPRSLPRRLDYRIVTAKSETLSETMAGVRFFPDGSSTGGRVTAGHAGHARLVDIDWLTGKVALLAPDSDPPSRVPR